MRLLQQTLRTTQCDRQPAQRPPPAPDSPAASDQTQSPAVTQGEIDQLEALLQERDEQIQSLCGHMERLALEKDSLQQELKGLKIKVGEINDQQGMLMETIQAKDEVIIKLSQESSEQSGNPNDPGSPSPNKDQQEVDILKVQTETLMLLWELGALIRVEFVNQTERTFLQFQDSLQGYKSQNKFLNKEILELTVLRRNAESREKTLEAKVRARVGPLTVHSVIRNRKSE